MSSNITFRVIVKTGNPEPLKKLFTDSDEIINDKFSCELKDVHTVRGAIAQEFIFEILINVGIGLSTGILSSWIYEKLSNKKENTVNINNNFVFNMHDIEIILTQNLQNKHTEQ